MADTKGATTTLSGNDSLSNVTLFLTLLVAVLPTYYLFFVKPTPKRRQTSEDGYEYKEIPWAPGWVPVLGHALSYKEDPAGFLTDTSQYIVGGIFQLNLAGKHMIVVCGPAEQKLIANMPESKMSARKAVADVGFEQTLGTFNVRHGADLHKGIVKGIWHNQSMNGSSNHQTTSRQGGGGLVTHLTEQLQQALFLETSESTKPKHHDFFKLIRRVVLRSVIQWMIAPDFLEGYPTFLEEFMIFQDQLEDVTAKSVVLPRWVALPAMIRPLQRKREKLQQKILKRLEELVSSSKQGDKNDASSSRQLGFWLEEILEKTQQDLSTVSELVVGLLFAAHKNAAIGAAQSYLLLKEMGTSEDDDLCSKEAHRFLQSPDWDTLQSCQRLRRLCLETLRLTAHSIGGLRTAMEDIPMVTEHGNHHYLIPKGASVGLSHIASSWNPNLWKDPQHLDTTNRSGDFYQDEYLFTTFSHGVHKCPGQSIAMVILQSVLALLLQDYEVTLPKDIPPLSFERATLAQRQGPVMVAIQPRN